MYRKKMLAILKDFGADVIPGYRFKIKKGFHKLDGDLAEVDPDIYEKTALVTLSYKFKRLPDKRQRNILIHEVVHCRLGIKRQKIEKFRDEEDEFMVNDITRALEKRK